MDEDDEGEGRQLTVLGDEQLDELEVSYEELAEEKGLLTEEQIHRTVDGRTVRDGRVRLVGHKGHRLHRTIAEVR
jgi:hypothetical protein